VNSSRSLGLWIVIFVAGFLSGVVFSAWKLDRTPRPPLTTPMAQEGDTSPAEQSSRLTALEKLVAENPTNAKAAVQLADAYLDAGQFQKAVTAYQNALKLDPDNADACTDMGAAYRKLGKTEESVAAFKQALAINPAHALALFNLGLVLRDDAKDYPGALAAWEKFLEQYGDSPHAVMVKPWVAQLKQKLSSTTPPKAP
jgi:cytochrome c-type biogenesis protein CcmH/NrfG